MAIRFKCDCGKALKVADELAGKRGKCPGCGSVVTVPVATAVEVAPEELAASPTAVQRPLPPAMPVVVEVASPYASQDAPVAGGPVPWAAAGTPPGRTKSAGSRPLDTARGRLVSVDLTNKGGTFCFQAVDTDLVAGELYAFFAARGYKLEVGARVNGTYGIGSDVLRVLFGAFAKRYKFHVQIQPQGGSVWLYVTKAISGAMGGVIGYSAMNKETAKITEGIRSHFGG